MKAGKIGLLLVGFCLFICATHVAAESITYDFNTFSDGQVNGQDGWKILRKRPGKSAVSIFDELGPTETAGDKALVIQLSDDVSRVVGADGLRWMPGQIWSMDFDFRVGITAQELAGNKPVLTVFVGNAYLSPKTRWEIRLEAEPDGTWTLSGGLPFWKEVTGIVADTVVERPEGDEAAVSNWMHFTLITKKLPEPDSFESYVEIRNSQDEIIACLAFLELLQDKKTASMWNQSRLHFGFNAPLRQLGLVCIDNIEIISE